MIQNRKLKPSDYERVSKLIGKLFEFEIQVTEEITRCIEYYGVDEFFRKLETFDFSVEVFESLHAVRQILSGLGEVDTMLEEEEEGDEM